ncbi:MAG: dehydrogenase, partial [Saprospiraceae bacterium]|nr:dehydrogenase [Saprospiraceae bacterium]
MAHTLKLKPSDISSKRTKKLYKALIKPRLIEEKMLLLLRQGKISKWFSGIGQEAISVGCTMAMNDEEKIFTMHRNLGVFTTRDVPFDRLFAQWQGKDSGFTHGRDRSFHFGTQEYNIVGMISHLGPQLSLAAGAALAYKLRGEKKVSLAFTGEGGTSQGEFHEAMNVAAVWKLPVIFIIENNGYGLSTPVNEQYACEQLSDRAAGYGMKSVKIDGNNAIEVYQTIKKIRKEMISDPQPYMVECMTFRMRGHEEASGQKYVPKELIEEWAEKDPIQRLENHMVEMGIWNQEEMDAFSASFKEKISTDLDKVFLEDEVVPELDNEVSSVFKEYTPDHTHPSDEQGEEIRFIDAISDGIDQAMGRHSDLVIMGQDIAEYGGVFKITEGMCERYGKDRVRNTPLCESAILGIALGLSIEGMKSMVEMQFADFVTCGFNQIVNNMAKLYYRWGQNADVVIRMP